MRKKFSEITLHKTTLFELSPASCIVEREGKDPMKMSFNEALEQIHHSLMKEMHRIPVGSSLRIMVLTKEREVEND